MNLGWRLFSEGEEELTESVGLVGVDAANELATAHNLGNVGVMRVGRLPLEANDVADMNDALPVLAVAAGVSGCNVKDDHHLGTGRRWEED